MPNHIHLIWQILLNYTPANVQRDFMKYTSQRILQSLRNENSPVYNDLIVESKDRKRQVWQRSALSIELYTEKVFQQKLNYIHSNPCQDRWQLVEHPENYIYSSAEFYETGKDRFGFLTHESE